VIGVLATSGEMLVPPPLDRKFVEGDQVVAISEDADTVVADGTAPSTKRRSRPTDHCMFMRRIAR